MSVFVGESIRVATFDNLAGSAIATRDDIAYRAGSSTFTAGDIVSLAGDLGSSTLVAPDTTGVTVSWAIVVLSGSGTFSGSESGDIAAGGALGSVSVSGAGTYLLPSTVTVADILANGDADLELTCTSGTIVVQQVKLRVWPTGGVVGGWSSSYQPADVRRDATARRAWNLGALGPPEGMSGASGAEVVADVQTYLRGVVAANPIGVPLFADSATMVGVGFAATATEFEGGVPAAGTTEAGSKVGLGVAYILHPTGLAGADIDPPGMFGTDWTYPPDEVWMDPAVWDVTGSDGWAWAQDKVTLRMLAEAEPSPGAVHVAVSQVDDIDPPGTEWSTLASGGVSVVPTTGNVWVPVALPSPAAASGWVRVVAWHDGAFTEQEDAYVTPFGGDPPGTNHSTGFADATVAPGLVADANGDGADDTAIDPVGYWYTPAPFRYWVPSVARVIPLRQFHRDDGLGVTPPRAYGGSSRTRTGRAYGYT